MPKTPQVQPPWNAGVYTGNGTVADQSAIDIDDVIGSLTHALYSIGEFQCEDSEGNRVYAEAVEIRDGRVLLRVNTMGVDKTVALKLVEVR